MIGNDLRFFHGGKGANQAVAAARLGARVRMIGRVGNDSYGENLLVGLSAEGIDTSKVRPSSGPTGTALITVDAAGQNSIVVVPGANAQVVPEDLAPADFAGAAVTVLQLEIPLETVSWAATLARSAGSRVLLNAAPAQPLTDELLQEVDVLVVNEFEAAQVAGAEEPQTPEEALELARRLAGRVPVAVITLGERGLVWAGAEGEGHMPAFEVEEVDTTAAGDAFVGGLAAALAAGEDFISALSYGSAAGALAATEPGAQASLPGLKDLFGLIEQPAEETLIWARAREEAKNPAGSDEESVWDDEPLVLDREAIESLFREAKRTEIERQAEAVDRFLAAIGYPEALVTDLSRLSDFCPTGVEDAAETLRERIRQAYGVEIEEDDFQLYLWQLIDKLERHFLA